MQKIMHKLKWLNCFLIISLFFSINNIAVAGFVSTQEILNDEISLSKKDKILSALAVEKVRVKLINYGVSVEDVEKRVENMSEEEIQLMANNIENLKAGSGSFSGFSGVMAAVILGFFLFLVMLSGHGS